MIHALKGSFVIHALKGSFVIHALKGSFVIHHNKNLACKVLSSTFHGNLFGSDSSSYGDRGLDHIHGLDHGMQSNSWQVIALPQAYSYAHTEARTEQ